MTKTNKQTVAVVGAGNWGKNLVRNFHELGVLKAVSDKNSDSLKQMQKLYPSCDFYSSLKDVLSRDDIAGVAIATPAETHFLLAREALLSGKHVFVEKPLTLSEKDAIELIALAQKNNLVLMVGHRVITGLASPLGMGWSSRNSLPCQPHFGHLPSN